MVVYVKDHKGQLKTIQDLALEFQLPISLVYSRYNKGIRDIAKLTQGKYEVYKNVNKQEEAK